MMMDAAFYLGVGKLIDSLINRTYDVKILSELINKCKYSIILIRPELICDCALQRHIGPFTATHTRHAHT